MTAYMQLPSGTIIETNHPENWKEAKRPKNCDGKAALVVEARKELLETLKPGSKVYTVLRHVSASGMSRRIDLYTIENNEPRYLSGYAAKVMGMKLHKDGGIVVGGCGMDMGFHLVYELGSALWPKGTPEPHGTRNGTPDRDGGYALKHHWL